MLLGLVARPHVALAQDVEVAPYYGYRFGGGFFELVSGRAVDADGAPAVGFTLNVPLGDGLQLEGLFTHQSSAGHITVDHWLGGALQEVGGGRVRPFTTGMLGLTRYALDADQELRFAVAAGGGVKAFPVQWLGLRLDGRVFATFVDVDSRFTACTPNRGCVIALDTDIVWQAEFTAGVTIRLPVTRR
jgi:hypothetical protein